MLLKNRLLKSPCSQAQTPRWARGRVSLLPSLWGLLSCPSCWLSVEKKFVLEKLGFHPLAMKQWALCGHLNSQVSLKWTGKAGRRLWAQKMSELRSMKAPSTWAFMPFDRWEGCLHFLLRKAIPECLGLWMMKKKTVRESGEKEDELNHLNILNCLGSPGKRKVILNEFLYCTQGN